MEKYLKSSRSTKEELREEFREKPRRWSKTKPSKYAKTWGEFVDELMAEGYTEEEIMEAQGDDLTEIDEDDFFLGIDQELFRHRLDSYVRGLYESLRYQDTGTPRGKVIKNGLNTEDVITSLEGYLEDEDVSLWTHVDFDTNEEDVGLFARTYLELEGHKNPKDIVSVVYDEEFSKAIDWFGDIDAIGAYLVTYKDGSTETLAYQFGGDELYKVKWVKPPRYPKIKF